MAVVAVVTLVMVMKTVFVRQSNSSVQSSFITDNEDFVTSYQKCFVFDHFSNQPCKLLLMRCATKRTPGTILRSARSSKMRPCLMMMMVMVGIGNDSGRSGHFGDGDEDGMLIVLIIVRVIVVMVTLMMIMMMVVAMVVVMAVTTVVMTLDSLMMVMAKPMVVC